MCDIQTLQFSLLFAKNFTNYKSVRDSAQQTFYKALGARIREIRGSKLSQEQLAKAADLSRTSIVNIESGRQKLLVHNLFQISKALKVLPSELLATLEPSSMSIPEIDASSEAAEWVQRSVKKAIQTQSSQ
jgi:transcriptional regulator with XRE-family HTH domain